MCRFNPLFFLGLLLAAIGANSGDLPDLRLPSERPADGITEEEGLTHLQFFWHNRAGGPNPTVVEVAKSSSTNSSATGFGTVVVVDDPITIDRNQSSELLGYSQGIYVSADQKVVSLALSLTFNFISGEYNGSTFSILGRDVVSATVREIPIVGGTGRFRFAAGFTKLRTTYYDPKISYYIVHFNCYIKLGN